MNTNKLYIPGAIVLAGIIIAGAMIYSGNLSSDPQTAKVSDSVLKNDPSVPKEEYLKPISSEDHILGNLSAPIKIVEYSDTECPFCKNFHLTMHQVVEEYGGQVAWVYRHFPLPQLHPKAPKQAEATECAAELGGNDAFWNYIDRIFKITPSNNGLDMALLPEIAEYVGLDRGSFQECLDSGRHEQKIADDYNSAVESGGRGTPFSIIISKDGKKTVIPGTLPYSSIKSVIDKILQEE
ncbi:MAG: DsbA family protein [bacterium]|nr:DsbA family protein [bacterium]